MTKVQKWFAKLRNRIFFSFVGCFLGIMLLIMGVFQFSSQKYFSQHDPERHLLGRQHDGRPQKRVVI